MSDLLERLRTDLVPHDVEALVEEAADEIERLTARIAELEGALKSVMAGIKRTLALKENDDG